MDIPSISICSFFEAKNRLCNEPENYDFLLSIGSKQTNPPDGFNNFKGNKLRVEFDDVSDPSPSLLKMGLVPPQRQDIKEIINFCKEVNGPILIHCAAGISRSSASALILIALNMGYGYEKEAVQYLLNLKDKDPLVFPNELMVHYADNILGHKRNLVNAYNDQFYGL